MPAATEILEDHPSANRPAADGIEANGQANGFERHINLLLLCGRAVEELPELEANLPPGARVVGVGRDLQELTEYGVTDEILAQVHAVLTTGNGRMNVPQRHVLMELWPKLRSLEWVHTTAAGLNRTLFPELVESDVILTNGRGNCKSGLAEFAITSILHFAKHVPRFKAQQQSKQWTSHFVDIIKKKTLGVLGYGEIGQETARLARAFGMKVLALRRNTKLSHAEAQDGLKVYSPEQAHELLPQCDYVLDSLPSTQATHHFLNADAFEIMKPNAVIINVGRGTTIDEPALIEALKEGRIRGAALDVFEVEPLPQDSQLWEMDNVLMTPHCGGVAATFWQESFHNYAEQVQRFVAGKPLLHVANKQQGY